VYTRAEQDPEEPLEESPEESNDHLDQEKSPIQFNSA
jgi:hypothetical protein